ncbi:MAG: hypothetical protein ACJAS1_005724, partial [Oleiphilaceae bacterium]
MEAEPKKITTNQPSLALRRLKNVLALWNKDRLTMEYEHLYVCARNCGEKVKSVWISRKNESSVNDILLELTSSVIEHANSFEVEYLFEADIRELNLKNKNQWNSFRGKRAIIIRDARHNSFWSSLEMIARNLSFKQVANYHLAAAKTVGKSCYTIPVTLYKTKQYLCNNDTSDGTAAVPVSFFRGNNIVELESVNQASVFKTIKMMTHWLASQINQEGQANYKYWPSNGKYASSNNPIRQWMATVCLNRAAKAFNNVGLQQLAERNLAYNLDSMYQQQGDLGYIWLNNSAKLGSAALAALAILESPQRKKHLKNEYGLRTLIQELSNTDGSFDTFLIPRERKDNQNFYSGEALLFLATQFAITKNPIELERIMAGFYYYKDWHLKNRNPAFIPWHTQAYYLVWKITKNEALKEFIFEMNDWLLSFQQWDLAEFSDMQGRFYDPKRSYYGPPHASSTGVYLEGMIDAFQIAKDCNDQQRTDNYRQAILRGVRSIMQLQYKDAADCFYIKHVNRVLGGVRTTVYDNTIRIDNVQHALMAFLKIHSRFSEPDYQYKPQSHDPRATKNTNEPVNYKYFKKILHPIPFGNIRKEIEKNVDLWEENTSRQENLKVQRETQTIFLRTAQKPFTKGYSGNDVQRNVETANVKYFPLLMKTLYEFAQLSNGELSRVTIVRLQPLGEVYPHIDEGKYYSYRDRYHIVVDSQNGSIMAAGDENLTWHEGEFWRFDNKALHSAINNSDSFRVHIIFDVLPNQNRKAIEDLLHKQALLIHPVKLISLKENISKEHINAPSLVQFPPLEIPTRISDKISPHHIAGYTSNPIDVDVLENAVLFGDKFVIANQEHEVYRETLPTYLHEPDPAWLDRKPFIRNALYDNPIVRIEHPCAVIANANWKNYWHWHAQTLTSIRLLKKSKWWGEVKLLIPPLNEWRRASLEALGVDDSMCIKIQSNLVFAKKVIRPSLLNKFNQIHLHPK